MNRPALPEEERKIVTVLFADLVSSTELASRLDPEDLRSVQRSFFGAMRTEIVGAGGTVEKFIGDAVVAVFGAPMAHEDDPVRAVRAALALRERLAALSHDLGEMIDAPLTLRIGIATGEVVTVPADDALVTGETVNIASRLEAGARPGAIVVDERTRRQSRDSFEYRALGRVAVRGIDRRLPAWELVAARLPSTFPSRTTPLVGRGREVGMIVQLLDGLVSGRGGVLAISGEPGTGKSRLLAEVRALAVTRGLTVLHGRAVSLPGPSGYSPFREFFGTLIGVETGVRGARSWERCEAIVRELAPEEADELLLYVGILAGLDVPEPLASRLRYLEGAALRGQVFRAARRLVAAFAKPGGVVLALDDVHALEPSSAELTEHLVPLVRSLPVVILITTRTDPVGATRGVLDACARACPDRFTELELEPLEASATAQLLENILSGGRVRDDLARLVVHRTGGVPLFVEELVSALREASVIVRGGGNESWRLAGSVADVALPDTLRGLVAARLDALPRSSKDLVKAASVIGLVFTEELLRGVLSGRSFERELSDLRRLGVIGRPTGDQAAWEFRHPLIQEAAYASILHRDRRRLHELAADSIEAAYPQRLTEFAAALAHHYVQAERWDRAQPYLFEAGDRASRVAADAESVDLYRGALSAYERAFGDRWDPIERAMLERRLGEALFRRGDHADAIEHLRVALRSLGARDPYTSSSVIPAIVWEALRQALHVIFGRGTRARSGPPDTSMEERTRVYHVMAWIEFFTDPRRFVLNRLITANAEERAGGSPLGLALAYAGLGGSCDIIPALRVAEIYHRRAVMLAESADHPLAIGQTRFVFGLHEHHGAGSLETALEHYRSAAAAYREADEFRGAGAAEWFIAWIDAIRGDLHRAAHRWTSLEDLGRDTGDPAILGWALMGLGSLLWRCGEPGRAVDRLREAVVLFESIPDHQSRAYAAGHLAIALLRAGQPAEAERTIAGVEAEVRARGLRGFPCTPHRVAAAEALVASLAGGRRLRALKPRRTIRKLLRQSVVDRDCLPDACRLAGVLHWQGGSTRKADRWWRRGLEAARATGATYDEARILLEMSQRLDSPVAAQEADTLLSRMGLFVLDGAIRIDPGRADLSWPS